VKAKNAVELHQPARMKGNIDTPSLMIEKGVTFEGQCKMDVPPEKPVKASQPSVPSPAPLAPALKQ
jgi:cytoskeletal protein CcmA (bactofilin family)